MADSTFTPPFAPSVVAFSNMNEDYQVELEALHHLLSYSPKGGEEEEGPRSLRVCCVASSGETSLCLLSLPEVSAVEAVDLSEWQVHLCELRRAALLHLGTAEEQLRLFGMDPAVRREGDEQARLALYDRLREHLPAKTREAWDQRRDLEIAFGLGHVGQSDIINHDLQLELQQANIHVVEPPHVSSSSSSIPLHLLPENERFAACWKKVYSLANFRKRFAHLHINQQGMDEMIQRHWNVLHRSPSFHENNYFFAYYYTNYYCYASSSASSFASSSSSFSSSASSSSKKKQKETDNEDKPNQEQAGKEDETEKGRPLFLQTEARQRILKHGATTERLRYHVGDIFQLVAALSNTDVNKKAKAGEEGAGQSKKFDLISISNILDWIPEEEEAVRLLRGLQDSLNEGGIVLVRHETRSNDYFLRLSQQLPSLSFSPSFNSRLLRADRALLTRDIAAFFHLPSSNLNSIPLPLLQETEVKVDIELEEEDNNRVVISTTTTTTTTTNFFLPHNEEDEDEDQPLWVFAYGSLMWNPGFSYGRRSRCILHDAQRSLCMYSIHLRGTPEKPGLVLGLHPKRGASCLGMCFEVRTKQRKRQVLEYLEERENTPEVCYRRMVGELKLTDEEGRATGEVVRGVFYFPIEEHHQYAGHLYKEENEEEERKQNEDAVMEILRTSRGKNGTSLEYLENTLKFMEEFGIEDVQLRDLLVRAKQCTG
ncbi:Gamma-glutamylcyclotransferase [Balamuthia mandrillaris]